MIAVLTLSDKPESGKAKIQTNSHQGGSADGGDRTHTHLRELDFESSASANSATSAFVRRQLVSSLLQNARVNEGRIQELQEFRSYRMEPACWDADEDCFIRAMKNSTAVFRLFD